MRNWKVCGRSGRGLILRHCPGIFLKRLRKTTKNLNHDSRSQGPKFEPHTSRLRRRSANHSTTTFDRTPVDCRSLAFPLKLTCLSAVPNLDSGLLINSFDVSS
jgi:hypothetical protein